ncbi:MAG: hypothetical protein ABIG71_02265, partial [Candidatus Uhrbacteria bacterium]
TIVYRPLEAKHLATIAEHHLGIFAERLAKEQNINIAIDDGVYAWIAQRAFDPAQGARAVRRLLHAHVENLVASGILEERFAPGSSIRITTSDDGTALLVSNDTTHRVKRQRTHAHS